MYAHVGWCRASDCSGAAPSPPNSGDCRTAPTSQHSLEYVVCGRILGRRGEGPRPTFFSCRTCATERGCTRMSVGAEQATALAQPYLRRNSGDCRTAPTSQHSLEYVVCGRILGRRGEPPVLRFSLAGRARLREDVRACRLVPSKRLLWRSPISAEFRRLSDCTHIATFLRVRGLWANPRPSRGGPPSYVFLLPDVRD